MYNLLEQGLIQEMACETNFAYVLKDSDLFLPIEYKVLRSQSNDCFVRCVKMLYNGKVQLYYLVNKYRPLSKLLPQLTTDRFLTIITNLFSNVITVKGNGFLSCQNIDITFEHIYVDLNTLKVGLVYLPVSQHVHADVVEFENELRTGIIKQINRYKNLRSPQTGQFAVNLSNGMLSLEDLLSQLKQGKIDEVPGTDYVEPIQPEPSVEIRSGQLKLVAMNAPNRIEIVVDKDHYTLGKKASVVDGVISFNDKISRRHCRIDRKGSEYTITDLGSANGTSVNRMPVPANMSAPIRNGDTVRLANSDFKVQIR